MKFLAWVVLFLGLALSASAQDAGESTLKLTPPTWSVASPLATGTGGVGGCNGSSCTVTQTIAPGELLLALASQTSSIQAAGTVTGGGGTWHLCTACHVYAPSVYNLDVNIWYSTDATVTGSTTFTVNLAGAGTGWSVTMQAFSCSGCGQYGPIAVDQIGSVVSTTCTTCSLSSFTNLAGQDFVYVFLYSTVAFPSNSWPSVLTIEPTYSDSFANTGSGKVVPAGTMTNPIVNTSSSTMFSIGISFRP